MSDEIPATIKKYGIKKLSSNLQPDQSLRVSAKLIFMLFEEDLMQEFLIYKKQRQEGE